MHGLLQPYYRQPYHTQVCTAFALAERQVTKATSLVTKFQPGVGTMVDRLCTTGRATVVTDAERQRVLALLVPGHVAEGDCEVDLPHLAVTHTHLVCLLKHTLDVGLTYTRMHTNRSTSRARWCASMCAKRQAAQAPAARARSSSLCARAPANSVWQPPRRRPVCDVSGERESVLD